MTANEKAATLNERTSWWHLLPPLFVSLFFLAWSLYPSTGFLPPLSLILFLPLCLLFRMKATLLAALSFALYFGVHYLEMTPEDRFVSFLFFAASFLTLLIFTETLSALEEAKTRVDRANSEYLKTLFYLDEKLKKNRSEAKEKERSLQRALEEKSVSLQDLKEHLKSLEEKEERSQEELLIYAEKQKELIDQLLSLRKSQESGEGQNLKRVHELYKQLKEQFTQKTKVLDETRKELFQAQETALALERELKEKLKFEREKQVKDLERHMKKMGERVASLEEERDKLEELIGVITSSKE